MKQQFVCANLELTEINQGIEKYECKQWAALSVQESSPPLTKQQADDITAAVLGVLVSAFSWTILIKIVRMFSHDFKES